MIITCTTIPPRMKYLPAFFANLARQKLQPEAVELYVPFNYRRFPGQIPALPNLPSWVTVIRIDDDLGPATKVLPGARRWQGKGVELLFGDDDRLYDPLWTTRFAETRKRFPGVALCERGLQLTDMGFEQTQRATAERPLPVKYVPSRFERFLWRSQLGYFARARPAFAQTGYLDTFEGYCGVLVRPEWFDEATFDIPPVLWTVDDIWLSGHVVRQGIDIRTTEDAILTPMLWLSSAASPLFKHVEQGADRNEANARCVRYFQETYGIWLPEA